MASWTPRTRPPTPRRQTRPREKLRRWTSASPRPRAILMCLGAKLKEWKKDIDRCYNSRFGNMSRNKQLILKNISQQFHTTFFWSRVGSPSRHITTMTEGDPGCSAKNQVSVCCSPSFQCWIAELLVLPSLPLICVGIFFHHWGGRWSFFVDGRVIKDFSQGRNRKSKEWLAPQKTKGFCSTRSCFLVLRDVASSGVLHRFILGQRHADPRAWGSRRQCHLLSHVGCGSCHCHHVECRCGRC